MNKLARMGVLLIFGSTFFSCQNTKTARLNESQFYTDSIFSENLREYRKHDVYLPNGFDKLKEYRIIYATDGTGSVENSFYKRKLDSLIDNRIIIPTIYIASHSNSRIADIAGATTADGKKLRIEYRNFEYVENISLGSPIPHLASRFQDHLLYFKDELIPQVEKEFGQDIEKGNRLFYGYSNGAGFGANLLNKYPDLIGTYICFSTLGSNVEGNLWNREIQYPDLYLQYGSQESMFFKKEAEDLVRRYKESNSFLNLEVYDGGHDNKKWREGFIQTISKLLSVR